MARNNDDQPNEKDARRILKLSDEMRGRRVKASRSRRTRLGPRRPATPTDYGAIPPSAEPAIPEDLSEATIEAAMRVRPAKPGRSQDE